MEQELIQNQNPAKEQLFWSLGQIVVATFIGGFLGGSYLLGRNYSELGYPDIAKKSYWIGALGTLLLLFIVVVMPEDLMEKLPSTIIPAVSISAIIPFAQSQKKEIQEKFGKENKRYSYWRCLGLGLSLLILQAPFAFLFGYLYGMAVV